MNLCRLCGEEKSPLDLNVELNDITSSSWSYRDLIEHHTRVSLKSSKLLPQSICEECRSLIDGFAEFSSKVQSTQNKFEDDQPIPEIKECFVQIEQIDEGLLERSSSSRGRRKRTINYNEQEDSPTKRGRFEAITLKVEPEESSSDVKIELEEFMSKVKEEINTQEAPTGRLRQRKKPVEIYKSEWRRPNPNLKPYITKNQPLYGDEIDTLEKLFDDEINGKSKFPLLHLDTPESCKLPSGEVPEEFAQKVSTLTWKDIFGCLVCGDEIRFDNVLDLKKHQLEVHNKTAKVFGCHLCQDGAKTSNRSVSSSEITLLNHFEEKHFFDHLKFCCMVCSKMFYDLPSLHQHYKTHEGGFHTLTCFICGFTSRDMECIKYHKAQHILSKKTDTQLLCEKIQDKFNRGIIENPTNVFVEDHERNSDGTVSDECQRRLTVDWSFGTYNCSMCPGTFPTPFKLFAHNFLFHPLKKKHENPNKKIYSCNICEKRKLISRYQFDHFFTFMNHAIDEQHDKNLQFTCVSCLKCFWNLRSLVNHYKEIHPSINCVLCNHCGKMFPHCAEAAKHYNNEVAEDEEKIAPKPQKQQTFVCEICGFKAPMKANLKSHILHTHKMVKPEDMLTCEICGWKVATNKKLSEHMRTHSDLKPFSCEICGDSFKWKRGLRRHKERIHENIKDFKCSLCDRKFYTMGELKIHERRHKGEKPFICTESGCTAAYADITKLKLHLKNVHGIDARTEVYKLKCAAKLKLLEESEKNESEGNEESQT